MHGAKTGAAVRSDVAPVRNQPQGDPQAMKKQGRYHHLGVDWPGESFSELVTLCGGEGGDAGTEQPRCPDCAQVALSLNFCGLGPDSLRQFFSAIRAMDPFALKAQIEALRGRAVEIENMQDRASLN